MKRLPQITFLLLLIALLAACKKDTSKANFTSQVEGNSAAAVASLQDLNTDVSPIGVIELPSSVDSKIRSTFKWYTKVVAPNGKPIHMLAQSNWTDEQVAYTRTILEHYLTSDLSIFYGDKTAVANRIADSHGAMTMFNGANDVSNNNSGVNGQDLQADETVAVGTADYLNASVRNAAFEEILHFVHDLGLAPAFPSFQMELEAATVNALDNQIFTPWGSLPVADYDNELLAAYNDAYWGLTAHNGGFDNPYVFLSRPAAEAGDPLSTAMLQKIMPAHINATMLVSSSFTGTFVTTFDGGLVYTHQSQYYRDVRLLGSNDANLIGNAMNNTLTGNGGSNLLTGGRGNDHLNGGAGANDRASYVGERSEYTINTVGGITTIIDNTPNRDGVDTLENIEQAVFVDQTVTL